MTRVGNIDQVLLLLREQLQRVGSNRERSRSAAAGKVERSVARPLDRVRALAALDTLGEEEVKRAVIRGILTDEFGEDVGNDARLMEIVDDVLRILRETAGGNELIERAVAQLKEKRA